MSKRESLPELLPESPTISSISAETDSRFIPTNVPSGYINGSRLNNLPTLELYAILPDNKNKIIRVTSQSLNPKTNQVGYIEGWRRDWKGKTSLNMPKREMNRKDFYLYDPKDNHKIETFLKSQASARGKKKTKTRRNKSRRNKKTKSKH